MLDRGSDGRRPRRGYVEGLERILGARPGSLRFPDLTLLREWQRWAETNRPMANGKDHA